MNTLDAGEIPDRVMRTLPPTPRERASLASSVAVAARSAAFVPARGDGVVWVMGGSCGVDGRVRGRNSLTLLSKNYGTMALLTVDVKTGADHTIASEVGARLCASIRHDVRASLGHDQLQ